MFARVTLLVAALAAIAWLAIELRAFTSADRGHTLVYTFRTISPSRAAEARRLLRDGSWGTPDQAPRVDGVALSVRLGALRDAERRANAIVHTEPANTAAWAWLLAATRDIDPARAQEARSALARLDPKGRRPLGH